MPKPQWGWFVVAVIAVVTGVFVVSMGFGDFSVKSGPPGGIVVAVLGLVAVWSFGKAFFNFRLPKD
jgi:high-affinity Fe2+/Pb2+ permease